MADFLPLILIILLGFLGGALVNFTVDWFYIRRKFLPPECEAAIKEIGWIRYFLWPWNVKTCSLSQRIRIWLVEILFIVCAIWLWFSPPQKVEFGWGFGLLVYFAIVVVMDLEFRVVLHPVSIIGGVIGLVFGIWSWGFMDAFIGGIAGFGFMYVFYKFGEIFIRWMSKRRGQEIDEPALGFGDVNMAGVVGLMLGWPRIVLGLLVAIIAGGVVSILYMVIMAVLGRLKAFSAIPYAPFLIFGAFILLYFRVFLVGVVN